MPIEMLNYSQLGQRLRCSPEAARALVRRMRLPRQKANDGKVLVSVDLNEISHRPMSARSPAGHHPVTAALKERVEELEAALVKLEAAAAGHRADLEHERQRAQQLMSELLRTIEEAMSREGGDGTAGRRMAALRSRPWWRRLAG